MAGKCQTPEPPEPSRFAEAWMNVRIWIGRQRVAHKPQTGKPIRTLIILELSAALLLGNLVASPHLSPTAAGAPGTITTIAGGAGCTGLGDGGPAIEACLTFPTDVAVDHAGNVYIADFDGGRLRKVDTNGVISTIAGNGIFNCFSGAGDGGLATATCATPSSLVIDAAGNIIFTDDNNSLVRSVDSNGILHTIAGTPGHSGFCGDGGLATLSCLNRPIGLALDSSGNLFIGDGFNSRIREVAAATGIITTVAGNGTDGFCGDGGPAINACIDVNAFIRVDSSGNLFIVDNLDERVRMVNTAGIISTVAGSGQAGFCGDGGQATQACFSGPIGIALGPGHTMYLSDSNNHRIRLVAADGTISTFAGNGTNNTCGDGGPALQACIGVPFGIFLDGSGNLFFAQVNRPSVREIFGSGGSGGGGGEQLPPTGGALGATATAGGGDPSSLASAAPGCVGQPIDTANGSLWHTCTDFIIPGRGLPLDFTRTYNSIFANQDGPVGFGWTFSYGMSLRQDPTTGDVTISQENGSQGVFHKNGSAYGAAPRGSPRWSRTAMAVGHL